MKKPVASYDINEVVEYMNIKFGFDIDSWLRDFFDHEKCFADLDPSPFDDPEHYETTDEELRGLKAFVKQFGTEARIRFF